MNLKTTLLFFASLGVGALVGYIPKTTTATGATNALVRTDYDNKLNVCPVVGAGSLAQNSSQNDDDGAIYKHCIKCETGVYLIHKEDKHLLLSKCTFCGSPEEISGE